MLSLYIILPVGSIYIVYVLYNVTTLRYNNNNGYS